LKTGTKRRLWVVAAAGAAGFLLLNVVAYRQAWAMMHFTAGGSRTREPEKLTLLQKAQTLLSGVNVPRPRTRGSPADLAPETVSLQLDCTNGIKLGVWCCAGTSHQPLVILFHGCTGEKSGTLPQARAFLAMGLSVLLVDFRGSGESSESYTTVGFAEAEDVAAAARHLATLG
jgi:uncharacterized protein